MGGYHSKDQRKDVYSPCKKRKKIMKQAIASWEALAITYSAYSLALKNVGAALSDYSRGIAEDVIHQSTENPCFSFDLKVSTNEFPATNIPKSPHFMCSPILENEEEIEEESLEIDDATDSTPLINGSNQQAHLQTNPENAAASGSDHVNVVVEIMNEIDQHFLEASKSSHQLLEILEAPCVGCGTRVDYVAQVLMAITGNCSLEGISDECEIHANILEWEERLYNELKLLESKKFEYERKVASLNVRRKGASTKAIAKAKATTSHFRAQYVVCREYVDSIISEINRLRDEVLNQKLVKLFDGMAGMWQSVHEHHESQLKIVADRLSGVLDVLFTHTETSQPHHERTALLWQFLNDWHSQFQMLACHQKEYIEALGSWVALTNQQIDDHFEENMSSPPIQSLLKRWQDEMDKVPYVLGSCSVNGFSDVICAIMVHQKTELNLRKKCEETQRDFLKKDPLKENLKRELEKELESYEIVREMTTEKSVRSLTVDLKELFQTLSEFALASSEMHKKLRAGKA